MKRLVGILVVAMFCCGFVPQHNTAQTDDFTSKSYAEALKLANIRHDTIAAREVLRTILERDSAYGPALNLSARLAKSRDEAIRFAERAYRSDTTNRYYLEEYGAALLRGGKYEEALPLYRKIADKSTEPDHYRVLAILLDGGGFTDEAISVVDTAESRFGRIPLLGRMRQYYLLKSNRPLEAESDARKAIEEAPYLAENHISLADIYGATGRDSLALVSYRNAIAIDSTDVSSWGALGDFYRKRGNHSAYLRVVARIFANETVPLSTKLEEWRSLTSNLANYRRYYPIYDALIKRLYIRNTDSRQVANAYAQHLIASGSVEQALDLCKQLLDPKSAKLGDYIQIIDIENYLGHTDSVLHYTNLALRAFPRNTQLLYTRGAFAAQQKRYDEALTYYNQALEYAENDTLRSSLWSSIGDLEHQRGAVKRSYKAYDKALKLHPDNALALNNYAYFLSLEGRDLERALTMITRALAISNKSSTYLDTMAWVLYKLGRYSEAKRYMQQALSLDRDNSAELALHYGDILHALGEDFVAKTYWRKALERGADAKEIEKRFGIKSGVEKDKKE